MALPPFSTNRKGYFALLGGFFLNIMLGTSYLWGIINEYLTSYFNFHNLKMNSANATIVNPIMITSFVFFCSFSVIVSLKVTFFPLF